MEWLSTFLTLSLLFWVGVKLYTIHQYVRCKKYLSGAKPPVTWSYYKWIMIVIGFNVALTGDLFALIAILYLGVTVIFSDHLYNSVSLRRR